MIEGTAYASIVREGGSPFLAIALDAIGVFLFPVMPFVAVSSLAFFRRGERKKFLLRSIPWVYLASLTTDSIAQMDREQSVFVLGFALATVMFWQIDRKNSQKL